MAKLSEYGKKNYINKKFEHDKTAFDPNISGLSRAYIIADEIARGSTYREISLKYSLEWGVSQNYMHSIISESIGLFQNEEYYKHIRDINNDRLNSIYLEARQGGDLKSAIKAVDTLNKANGVYEEKKQVQVLTPNETITVTFGEGSVAPVVNTMQSVPTDIVDEILNKKETDE